jgi:PAS domain S-box-containing protein
MPFKDKTLYLLETRPALLLGLLISFVVIFGLACILAYQAYSKAIEGTIRSNEMRATLLSKLILEHQRAAIGVLQVYANQPLFVDAVKRRDFEGVLKHLIDLAKNNPEMDWPFISNPDSTVWVNYPVDRHVLNKDLSHRDWYKGVSREWKPYISSVYKLIVGEQDLAVAVSAPILDEEGKVIGILATAQSTAFFRKIIAEVGFNLDATITLIDQEGHIIYSNWFSYTKEVISYPPLEFVGKALKGEKGEVEVRDAADRGRIKYVSFAPIEGIGWSIIVEKSRSEVLRSETSSFALIGLIAFLTYGFAVLLLVHLRQRHRQIQHLEKLNKELDGRVRERTAELEAGNNTLRAREIRLGMALEAAGMVTWEWDIPTGCIRYSDNLRTIVRGVAVEPYSSLDALMLKIHPEDRERLARALDETAKRGTTFECEYRTHMLDGAYRWILAKGKLVIEEGGKPVRVLGVSMDITDRKEAELQILKSEHEVRLVMNTVPALMSYIDTEFHYRRVNEGYHHWFGLVPQELEGRHVREALGEDAWQVARPRLERAMAGETVVYEEEMPYRTGGRRWVHATLVPDRDAAGKVQGLVALVTDITERKQTEAALEKMRFILSEGQRIANVGTFEYVAHDQTTVWSEEEYRIYGLDPEGPSPTYDVMLKKCIHPDDAALLQQTFIAAMQSGSIYELEHRIVRPDGSVRWVYDRAHPYFDQNGKLVRYVGATLDITERKRAEEALRASEERLRLATEAAGLFGWEVNLARNTFQWSGSAPSVVDIPMPETLDQALALAHPEDLPRVKTALEQSIAEGRKFEFECRVASRPAGEELWVYGTGVPIADKGSLPTRLVGLLQDITERKRVEEALKQRTLELQHLTETLEQRVKERTAELSDLTSQIVSAQEDERRRVSYDLHDNVWQTLLAIRSEIEHLFSDRNLTDRAVLRDKAKKVMGAILDMVGKIRSMQGDLWPYVLDDIGILATMDWYSREFEKNHPGMTIETQDRLSENEIPLSTKIVIYRILQETLSNVAKHSRASHVTLRLLKRDHSMEFTVEDNGIGFDPEETIAKRTPWGGLGLLNIKARTELSGGSFVVESAKGKGTTVRATWHV